MIATKGGLERPGPGRWVPNGAPEHLVRACEGSLARLRLEQIPLYQFHRPDPRVPLEESVGALVELKQQGKIRHIGLSTSTPTSFVVPSDSSPIVSVQNRYNLTDRSSESMVDLCEQEGIAFLPWAPIQEADSAGVSEIAARHDATSVRSRWPGCSPGRPSCCRSRAPDHRPIWRTTSPQPNSDSATTRSPHSTPPAPSSRSAPGNPDGAYAAVVN